jgi:hypothetical protein
MEPVLKKCLTILERLIVKQTVTIFIFLFSLTLVQGQSGFKTIVPSEPVVAGESFQVQYVMEDGDLTMTVKPPVFAHFRVVAGPALYKGAVSTVKGSRTLSNVVYTLEAIKPGRFIIPGATILLNGKLLQSNNIMVEVISRQEAVSRNNKEKGGSPGYFLRPGEDPYEKIRQNLFVKVLVDKKNCYVGEPVQATFKLYSRLESRSDIVKNPGFYGFTVYDVVNLADKQAYTEKLNGQTFDVHTIRKVQLYPLQAGVFTVDEMRVRNKVEFSRSAVNKKTEQEIAEGIFGNNEAEAPEEGTDVFETNISTEPVTIQVRPVPEKNRPPAFDGAAGRFGIAASLVKSNLSKQEEGFLDITVSGKGNFIQLSAPSVQWPAGIESFEPIIKDSLNKSTTPLSGTRTFRFPFVCAAAGTYRLPPVNFSFFNTDSNQFSSISSAAVEWQVSDEENRKQVVEESNSSIAKKSERAARTAVGIIVVLVLLILLYWISRKKEPEKRATVTLRSMSPPTTHLLDPAYALVTDESGKFYSTLHGIIWQFATEQFDLSGSRMNKKLLAARMEEAGIPASLTANLFRTLEECETGMFTNARLTHDREAMLKGVKEVVEKIRPAGD